MRRDEQHDLSDDELADLDRAASAGDYGTCGEQIQRATEEIRRCRAQGSLTAVLERYRLAHEALHRRWTAAVGTPGYVKDDWRTLDNELARVFRDEATRLGHPPGAPLLQGGAR